MTDRVCVARIGAAHGLRGEVRLQVFTQDPDAILKFGEMESGDGTKKFRVASLRPAKGHFVAKLDGVNDRNASELLTNIELFVSRDKLPKIEDDGEFYHADLIGLRVEDKTGKNYGVVIAVRNYGASDLLEVGEPQSKSGTLIPFIDQFVPEVDVEGGRVVIEPAAGLFDNKPSPLVGEGGERDRVSRVRGNSSKEDSEGKPLTRSSDGSRRRRPTLSHKGRGSKNSPR
jgi:16S rRNA processing protein RimM